MANENVGSFFSYSITKNRFQFQNSNELTVDNLNCFYGFAFQF